MGSLIGILSTVILVSTVCTLIFAVGAYVISRKGRSGVGGQGGAAVPGEDVADRFPLPADVPAAALFKRVQPGSSPAAPVDEEYQWK